MFVGLAIFKTKHKTTYNEKNRNEDKLEMKRNESSFDITISFAEQNIRRQVEQCIKQLDNVCEDIWKNMTVEEVKHIEQNEVEIHPLVIESGYECSNRQMEILLNFFYTIVTTRLFPLASKVALELAHNNFRNKYTAQYYNIPRIALKFRGMLSHSFYLVNRYCSIPTLVEFALEIARWLGEIKSYNDFNYHVRDSKVDIKQFILSGPIEKTKHMLDLALWRMRVMNREVLPENFTSIDYIKYYNVMSYIQFALNETMLSDDPLSAGITETKNMIQIKNAIRSFLRIIGEVFYSSSNIVLTERNSNAIKYTINRLLSICKKSEHCPHQVAIDVCKRKVVQLTKKLNGGNSSERNPIHEMLSKLGGREEFLKLVNDSIDQELYKIKEITKSDREFVKKIVEDRLPKSITVLSMLRNHPIPSNLSPTNQKYQLAQKYALIAAKTVISTVTVAAVTTSVLKIAKFAFIG
ncbi:hypothetical protein SNEBB_002190 [Seison nebaliae]|nr:hypothetical protein SNEBB_002190 [Seison nebaliae]